jgi:hypothetical protein
MTRAPFAGPEKRIRIMSRLGSRTFILAGNAFLASSVLAAAAGCTGGLYARSPNVEGPPVVEDDSEVVYAEAPAGREVEQGEDGVVVGNHRSRVATEPIRVNG